MIKLEVGKKYKTETDGDCTITHCKEGRYYSDRNVSYREDGICLECFSHCGARIVSEVVENPINKEWKDGLKNIDFNSCFPEADEYDVKDTTKQNTFTISVDLPQGTHSINVERTVSIDGVPYLANIKLERM